MNSFLYWLLLSKSLWNHSYLPLSKRFSQTIQYSSHENRKLVIWIFLSYVDLICYLGSLNRSGGTSQSISWPSKMMSFRRLPQGSLTWHSLSNRPGMLTLLLNFVGDSNSIKRKTEFYISFIFHSVYSGSSLEMKTMKIISNKLPLSNSLCDFLVDKVAKMVFKLWVSW